MANAFDANPGKRHLAVTPSDDANLEPAPNFLRVGTGGGDLAMMDETGNVEIWSNVADGEIIPFRPKRVMATGTSVSDIVAIYR